MKVCTGGDADDNFLRLLYDTSPLQGLHHCCRLFRLLFARTSLPISGFVQVQILFNSKYCIFHVSFQAGTYVIDLMDTFGGGTGVLVVGIFEMIGVMWFYGVTRFSNNLKTMLGFEPNYYWKICWAFCSPVFLVVSSFIGFCVF